MDQAGNAMWAAAGAIGLAVIQGVFKAYERSGRNQSQDKQAVRRDSLSRIQTLEGRESAYFEKVERLTGEVAALKAENRFLREELDELKSRLKRCEEKWEAAERASTPPLPAPPTT